MTRASGILLILTLVALPLWGASAEDPAIKIAVVDVDQALNSTEEGKAAREELSRKQREADAEVQPLAERFRELQEELKGKKYVLSDEALFQKQVELAELQNRIDNKIKELQGQLKIDQGRLEAPLRAKLLEIVEEIGKSQGFTVILARGTALYTREAIDMTDEVVARFDRKS